jgi:hypothetical protein
MSSAHGKATASSASGFELEGLEGRRLLSFIFVSSGGGLFISGSFGSGGGLVVSVGGSGHHHHHHGGHHHHTTVSVSVNVDHTHLSPATDAFQTLFPTHFPALPLPSFMPMH